MTDWTSFSSGAFESARRTLEGVAHRTPIQRCRTLSDLAGCDLSLKCENLQRGGAFKFRGAFRITATVVMPENPSRVKEAATLGYGAEVLHHGVTPQERMAFANRLANERHLTMVPPYEDPRILLGQGTVLMEILDQEPRAEVVLVPAGGGGLLGGICAAARAFRPGLEIYGVEPAVADDWARSLEAGRIVRIGAAPTIADGLRSLEPGRVPFPLVREVARGVLRVTEEQIRKTILLLLTRAKVVAEPSGAVSVAAALFHGEPLRGRRVVAVVSGGNVELETLRGLDPPAGP